MPGLNWCQLINFWCHLINIWGHVLLTASFVQDDKKEQDICQNVMIKSDWVSDLSKYEENPNNIGAHTCELKYINGARLKAFGLGYSCDVLKAGISGTKGANCVFTNILVL